MFRACASFLDSLFSCGSTVYGKYDEAFANEQARLIKDEIETYPPIIIETLLIRFKTKKRKKNWMNVFQSLKLS